MRQCVLTATGRLGEPLSIFCNDSNPVGPAERLRHAPIAAGSAVVEGGT